MVQVLWIPIFVLVILFVLIGTITGFMELPKSTTFYKDVSLSQYTRLHPELENSVAGFVVLRGSLGCIKDSSIEYLNTYDSNNVLSKTSGFLSKDLLRDGAFCSANLEGSMEAFIDHTIALFPSIGRDRVREDSLKDWSERTRLVDENGEKRVCFLPQDLKCSSLNIVKYYPNMLSYLLLALVTVILSYLIYALARFIYYFGIVYVIYGREGRKWRGGNGGGGNGDSHH